MNGHTTREDTQRIIGLLEQGCAAGDPAEDVMRRIVKQMPHVTFADIAQVATVHAEEKLRDTNVRAEALRQIRDIIRKTQQREENAQLTLDETLFLLILRAQCGDKRAVKLMDAFKAALALGL